MDMQKLRQTDADVVILPGARVSGDVVLGRDCSVWYNAVIRGDEAPITIGEGTNIQDNATLHTSYFHPMQVGSGVTVGHNAVLHSCTVGDHVLVGMGAIILDDAVIGSDCIIGAGALVTKGTVIPDGSMALGCPAVIRRRLTEEEKEEIRENGRIYARDKEMYR